MTLIKTLPTSQNRAWSSADALNVFKSRLAAGNSPGSPQMNSFGPNVSLAKDLLEKGERDVVIQYLELCRNFWKMDSGRLNQWIQEIKDGKTPQFGANLVY